MAWAWARLRVWAARQLGRSRGTVVGSASTGHTDGTNLGPSPVRGESRRREALAGSDEIWSQRRGPPRRNLLLRSQALFGCLGTESWPYEKGLATAGSSVVAVPRGIGLAAVGHEEWKLDLEFVATLAALAPPCSPCHRGVPEVARAHRESYRPMWRMRYRGGWGAPGPRLLVDQVVRMLSEMCFIDRSLSESVGSKASLTTWRRDGGAQHGIGRLTPRTSLPFARRLRRREHRTPWWPHRERYRCTMYHMAACGAMSEDEVGGTHGAPPGAPDAPPTMWLQVDEGFGDDAPPASLVQSQRLLESSERTGGQNAGIKTMPLERPFASHVRAPSV